MRPEDCAQTAITWQAVERAFMKRYLPFEEEKRVFDVVVGMRYTYLRSAKRYAVLDLASIFGKAL